MTRSMSAYAQALAGRVTQRFGDSIPSFKIERDEVTVEVLPQSLVEVCTALRDEPQLCFEVLIDICGVDYLEYADRPRDGKRFAAVYHLLSIRHNCRLRLKVFVDGEQPRVDSVVHVWASANWFEREAFDLFGILFVGHPDLRRILTDYGFIGHPFRKDFPLTGNVEMRYDPEKRRVIYEPVTISPRVTVPRVIRHDHRYVEDDATEHGKTA